MSLIASTLQQQPALMTEMTKAVSDQCHVVYRQNSPIWILQSSTNDAQCLWQKLLQRVTGALE